MSLHTFVILCALLTVLIGLTMPYLPAAEEELLPRDPRNTYGKLVIEPHLSAVRRGTARA